MVRANIGRLLEEHDDIGAVMAALAELVEDELTDETTAAVALGVKNARARRDAT